jgi:hypothetical protein
MSKYIPARLAARVRQRAGDCCEYCHLPQKWQEATFHIDHVQPKSSGGLTKFQNLALACVSCSLRKAARMSGTDPKSRSRVRLYSPRIDSWDEHFSMTSGFQIRGTTSIGRATVRALALNRPAIIAIRRELADL